MKKLLFPKHYPSPCFSGFLLSMRLLFGILLLLHGFDKLLDFSAYEATFPNPLGIGSGLSLVLVLFAELFCSLAFIVGFFFRLAVLPMIFAIGVAFFVTHDSSLAQGELAFIYLAIFLMLATTGPGIYSADYFISKICWMGEDETTCNSECC